MDWSNLNFSDTNTTLPAVNVIGNDNEYAIELAAPGMKKEDFKINPDENVLTISSERKEEKEGKKGHYSRREFSYQSFQRSFTLPVNIPKREEAKPKPAREITIS